ncbi:MAG: YggU family protein [SAR86 cluster bacterium]|uniref:UPF0235 protein COB20_08640 n=1 Tax=SAR86 cluster bacterium TaxID=2030880 RepID=A0A2A4X5F1_9GAMM|nr:MAG: YggU family protein [SAR86 cluster bacterium]
MYYRWEKEALYLDCSIQPKSNEDRIVGVVGEHLKIRISAAPTGGKANKHLVRYLAKLFHTKQAAITLVSGQTGRHKRLCIKKPLSIPPGLKISKDTSC